MMPVQSIIDIIKELLIVKAFGLLWLYLLYGVKFVSKTDESESIYKYLSLSSSRRLIF